MDGPRMHDSEDEAVASINIVPLVDVILVVLIIFMVTAVFTTVSALQLKLPKGSTAPAKAKPPLQIVVSVEKSGIIKIDGAKTTIDKLAAQIQAKRKSYGGEKTILTLQGDKDMAYGKLMPVLQEVSDEGLELLLSFTPPKG